MSVKYIFSFYYLFIFFNGFFLSLLLSFLLRRFVSFKLRAKGCINSSIVITHISVCSQYRIIHRFLWSRLKIKCSLSRWSSSLIHTGILSRSWKWIIHVVHGFLIVIIIIIRLLLSWWSICTIFWLALSHFELFLTVV